MIYIAESAFTQHTFKKNGRKHIHTGYKMDEGNRPASPGSIKASHVLRPQASKKKEDKTVGFRIEASSLQGRMCCAAASMKVGRTIRSPLGLIITRCPALLYKPQNRPVRAITSCTAITSMNAACLQQGSSPERRTGSESSRV